MSDSRRQNLILSGAFFVASGSTALAYEIIWFKRFAHVFGSSAHAWAALVAAYLLGLGLGARFLGAWAARVKRPLFAYGVCEIVISLCALAIPFEIGWVAPHGAAWSIALGSSPWTQTLVRFALTFIVLAPPTIAMGATLPLLVRHFVKQGESTGSATAVLYALNALGAGAGAWLAGFDLLPALGLVRANGLVVATSFVIGVAACGLGRGTRSEPAPELAAPRRDPALAFAAAATGAGALMLQMLWSRDLAVLIGSTTYVYSALLAVFVAGLGLGSLALRVFGRRADPLRAAAWMTVILIGVTLAVKTAQPWLALAAGKTLNLRAEPSGDTLVCTAFAVALVLVPTFAMGAIFPSLVALGSRDDSDAGAVGFVYGWNTFGSIPAAALTQVALFPTLGVHHVFRIALGLYVAALAVLWVSRRRGGALPPLAIGVGVLALVVLPRAADPLDTHRGNYLYGNVARETPDAVLKPLYFANGASADVLVVGENQDALPSEPRYKNRHRALFVNGKVDATTVGDMRTQVSLAYLPRLVRPNAKEILVIGMGSGTTAGASLLHPNAHVTCAEIESAVVEAARQFAEVNHSPWESPRFELVREDGRAFVQGTDRRFDLIVSEPSNPWMVGVSNLFTEEFYRTVAERLTRGGVLAQWMQTYALTTADYALILRTLRSVFPHVVLARINSADTILFASRDRILPDAAGLDAAQTWIDGQADVRADLDRWCGTTDARTYLLGALMLDERGVERLLASAGGSGLHSDLTLQIEYSAPRALFAVREAVALPQAIPRAFDLAFLNDTYIAWNCGADQVEALIALKDVMLECGRTETAAQLVELALAYVPDRTSLLVDQLVLSNDPDPQEVAARIEHLVERSPELAFEAGTILAQNGAPSRALPIFEALRPLHPNSPRVLAALATCYASAGRQDDAKAAIELARKIDPFDTLGANLERVLQAER